MGKNIFRKWKPLANLPTEIYLYELYQGYDNFKLLFKHYDKEEKILEIVFDPALVYRNIDEGDLLLYNRIDGEDGLGRWGLFTVEESDYLEWFHLTSQGIHLNQNVVHYAIYTPDDCLDILSAYPPEVKWLS